MRASPAPLVLLAAALTIGTAVPGMARSSARPAAPPVGVDVRAAGVRPVCPAGTIFVAPTGDDTGPGTQLQPLRTIPAALLRAQPGAVIRLAPGEYRGAFKSVRSGTAQRPITLCGPRSAIVRGTAYDQRVVEVNHDHLALIGFTIDGRFGADRDDKRSYAGKLVYAIGTKAKDGVTGLRLADMRFSNAGGECVRLRYFAQRNEVSYSEFDTCGLYDFRFGEGGKNGEAIYIGTAPEQRGMNGAPDAAKDRSDGNRIRNNSFVTRGNECVDIKEDSSRNLVEHNTCTGQRDKESAGFDARGDANTFRFNTSYGNRGSGIRFGGDGHFDGTRNLAYRNLVHDNGQYGIQMTRNPQGLICGNRMARNTRGDFRAPRAKLARYRGRCPRGTPGVD